MIIRKPQITDTSFYPEFFETLLRQNNIEKLNYKLSDQNYSGSNFCNLESFYNSDEILDDYNTLFKMPIIKWAKQTEAPDDITITPDSKKIEIKYYKKEEGVALTEKDFYNDEYAKNAKVKDLDFSDEHYEKINEMLKGFTTPVPITNGDSSGTDFSLVVNNSEEYLLTMTHDDEYIRYQLIYDKGYKKYRMINSSGIELGVLTLK